MKKTILSLAVVTCLLLGCHQPEASIMDDSPIAIPDIGFEAYLLSLNLDSDHLLNGKVKYGDIKSVDTLKLIAMGNSVIIKSLKGIEFFSSLKYLDCSGWQLESLDVSKNTNLEYLNCSSTPSTGEGYFPTSQIHQLTFGIANSKLTYLNCSKNAMPTLDLTLLSSLTQLFCVNNSLTELDVSNNKRLAYCWTYASSALKTIYVSSLSQIDSTRSQVGATNGHYKWAKDPTAVYKAR